MAPFRFEIVITTVTATAHMPIANQVGKSKGSRNTAKLSITFGKLVTTANLKFAKATECMERILDSSDKVSLTKIALKLANPTEF